MRNAAVVWLLVLAGAGVEARELRWRELAVRARLEADGTLRVEERHTMLFSGAWNGGERRFRVEPHQRLEIHGLRRGERPLREGPLDLVDRYAMLEDDTLRWRARDSSAPPFDETELVYTIDYSLENVLVPGGLPGSRRHTLDHDFAFRDRPGAIERFSLELALDPAWHSPRGAAVRAEAADLLPGESHVVTLPLELRGEGTPSSMSRAMAVGRRAGGWVVPLPMLIALALFLYRERRREASVEMGRGRIDREWLERNVLRHRPEVAGLFLHGNVGPPEVAAMLARMEQEGKIRTRLDGSKGGEPILHLELLVPTESLRGAERALARSLFRTRTETDTETIRDVYREQGFDPPSIIREEVVAEARRIAAIDPEGHGSGLGALLIWPAWPA